MEAIKGPTGKYPSSESLRKAMAVNQHHDAVTGTEKQHVTFDYAKRLSIGEEECHVSIISASFYFLRYSRQN